jgi:PE-PPE domain
MSVRKIRWLGFALLASAGAGLLALTSMMNSAFAFGDDTALVMGPSGFPVPPTAYVDAVNGLFLHLPDGSVDPLTTPEGLYPVTGVNTLPLDSSVAQGEATLNNAIMQQIADGDHVEVFGYSQSSIISSLEMSQLAANGVPLTDVNFVLVGDPNNPDGGMLERFDGLSFSSFGATFSGATPNDLYPTDIYTNEYDGFADFPRYPVNLLSDLNALLGIADEHTTYLDPSELSNVIDMGTYADTTYYMIPASTLPLLDPLLVIPGIGQPLYDLLEPDMSVLVNLGYGSLTEGWDSQNAPNIPTEFGLWPTNITPSELSTALLSGAQHGITDFIKDLQSPSFNFDWSSLQPLLNAAYTFGLTPTEITDPLNPPSNLVELINAISTFAHGDIPISATNLLDALASSATTNLGALLPLADAGLTLGVTIPEYDATLFLDGLQAGNLLDAFAAPIAADVALVPFALGFGGLPLLEAVTIDISEFASLIP